MSMRELPFEYVDGKPFVYRIGNELYETFSSDLAKLCSPVSHVFLVTDQISSSRTAAQLEQQFFNTEIEVHKHIIPFGKRYKNLSKVQVALDALHEFAELKDVVVVCVGPESVLNLGAFVASVYDGGVPYVLVPTTPTAALTSLTTELRLHTTDNENIVALTSYPVAILYDIDCEEELGMRTIKDGYPLLVKAACAESEYALKRLKETAPEIVAHEHKTYIDALVNCIYNWSQAAKKTEPRTPLTKSPAYNFGETFARVLDKAYGESSKNTGELLAEGLRFEVRLAVELCGLDISFVHLVDETLSALGFPELQGELDEEEVFDLALEVSENNEGQHVFALPKKAGEVTFVDVPEDTLIAHVGAFCESRAPRKHFMEVASDELDEETVDDWTASYEAGVAELQADADVDASTSADADADDSSRS